jgi:hypothetical protein
MTRQVNQSRKWILRYVIPFVASMALVVSAYYLLLPFERKLELFCVLDDAHLAEEGPVWVYGTLTCPRCGSNLTTTVIWSAIDAGMWVDYCETENIFWVDEQWGPLKGAFYGPYDGILWKLTNALNPIALVAIVLSVVALLYTLGYSTKTHALSHTEN